MHVERGAEQFQGYVNRFGPGMVIYWLGVIDELAAESQGRGWGAHTRSTYMHITPLLPQPEVLNPRP